MSAPSPLPGEWIVVTQAQRFLNLNVGINTTGYLGQAWPYRSGSRHDIYDPQYYRRLAMLAHEGRFAALFLSDMPLLRPDPQSRTLHSFDPLVLLTWLAGQVPDIGLVATMSSTYNSPFNFARRTQALDVLSGGRLMINFVSNFVPDVAANFGDDPLPPREVRYPRSSEFVDVVKKLWMSWDPSRADDVPDGQFWDPAQEVIEPNHKGQFYSVRGALNVPVSAQGYPVIAQAGGSDQGIDLAAQHGEVIYCNILSRGAGQAFRAKVNARATVHGRDPGTIKLAPGLVAIVGSTREEALRKHELHSGAGSEDGLIAQFAREHGFEPRDFDADTPLNYEDFIPAQDRIAAVGFTQGLVELLRHETLTARQVVRRSAGNHRLVLGTAEEVADQIIDLWADGTVDAYTYQPPRAPDDIHEFVDGVIPILMDRGVYRDRYIEGETLRERYGLERPVG
jgi:FMN-dependent oxidoreductase (nitrilotriacetate monooxygenase family)